jgi:DNA-binding IclR family transcriptional regulator
MTLRDRILLALVDGPCTLTQIVDDLGTPYHDTFVAVDQLARQRLVRRRSDGSYHLELGHE